MKIAFFSGPIDYSVCLANALIEYCEIDYFYASRYASQRDVSILNILNDTITKKSVFSYRSRDIRNLLSWFSLAKQLNKYDLIHVQCGNIWFSTWRHLFKKVPIIFTVHDPYQHPGIIRLNSGYQDITQKFMVLQSQKFIVHGEKLKVSLAKRYNLSFDDIKVMPHGELSFYKGIKSNQHYFLKTDSKIKRILFFGEVRKNKGLEYLIKAEPIISEKFQNYKICIAGKFPGDFEYYRKLIKDINRYEIFNEYIPNDRVATLFEETDIVVLPYISGTQSGVLALAFGFGKPVVATDVGSISEVLDDHKNGLLVPPCDENSLARALLELLLDEQKRLRFGENAKQLAEKKLSWKEIGLQTFSLYKKTIFATNYFET